MKDPKDLLSLFLAAVIFIFAVGVAVPFASYTISQRRSVGQAKESQIEQQGEEFLLFSDQELSSPMTSLDWGILDIGSTNPKPIFIKSTISSPTYYGFETYNWTPPHAENWLSLSWDYNNRSLSKNEVFGGNLVLSVSPLLTEDQNITDFSFNIVITCSEEPSIVGIQNPK